MAISTQQHAVAFEQDEPYAYHDPQRRGFFSLLVKPVGGRMQQTSHKLEYLPEVLRQVDRTQDTWISQGEFFKPNRRLVNLWRMPVVFVDLDTYNVAELTGLPVDSQLARLLRFCDDDGLPEPSIVVYSGRGLQVKWLLSGPIPASALPRWQAVQNELCQRLLALGADTNARDASRVLRVVDTMHSKSANMVRVVHWAATPTMGASKLASGLIAYDFEVLSSSVLPLLRDDLARLRLERDEQRMQWQQEKAARDARVAQLTVISGGKAATKEGHGNLRQFVRSQLAWDRIADIRKLAELRGWTHGAPDGHRDLPLFLCACFLAEAMLTRDIESELLELARQFAPTWSAADIRSCAATVYSRAQAAARGETVEFRGRPVDPRYRWRNATLIERLGITPQEEREMRTLVSKAEKRRRSVVRSAEARLVAGCQPRAQWLESVEQRRASARLLRAQGLSYPRIATELGVSVGAAHAYCKQ
ncbi:MAG: replication protein [Rhodoferax sp.]|nr:replication protein [Rhodoferax sp.]